MTTALILPHIVLVIAVKTPKVNWPIPIPKSRSITALSQFNKAWGLTTSPNPIKPTINMHISFIVSFSSRNSHARMTQMILLEQAIVKTSPIGRIENA